MMKSKIDRILDQLADLVKQEQFEQLESDTIEIKPVPADHGSWKERYISCCSFMNTRGGILILGIKEHQKDGKKKYVFTGYDGTGEEKLRELCSGYTKRDFTALETTGIFSSELRPFLNGQIILVFVDELNASQKYAFYEKHAYKRELTADVKIKQNELDRQEEYLESLGHEQELLPIDDSSLDDIDLDQLNSYIQEMNRPIKIETIKADIAAAQSFLERKKFILNDKVTLLGMLVCGKNPADVLGFKAQLHAYIDMPGVPGTIAGDKQDYSGSVLSLMEGGFSYVLRNTYRGISSNEGGIERTQYPEQLLRESINNALAHRDYSINKQVIVVITPGKSVRIQNPGMFRKTLLIDYRSEAVEIHRIIPEAKPRNPRLADVLRIYRKWEGRGIGMSTLVTLALENQIDLPWYTLKGEEVSLTITSGSVLDSGMEQLFKSFDGFIQIKTSGHELSISQKTVLAYLIKSERLNKDLRYSIDLSPDNNHFSDLSTLKGYGLVDRAELPDASQFVYVACREFLQNTYSKELYEQFGDLYAVLNETVAKPVLNAIWRFNHYSSVVNPSARQVALFIWAEQGNSLAIKEFDDFNRRVRYAIEKLTAARILEKVDKGYRVATSRPYGSLF